MVNVADAQPKDAGAVEAHVSVPVACHHGGRHAFAIDVESATFTMALRGQPASRPLATRSTVVARPPTGVLPKLLPTEKDLAGLSGNTAIPETPEGP